MNEDNLRTAEEIELDDLGAVAGGAAGANAVELEGQVVEALPNAMFQVQLDNGNSARCSIAGKLRMHYIRIRPGDRVRVEMNPGDSSKGRIVWCYK